MIAMLIITFCNAVHVLETGRCRVEVGVRSGAEGALMVGAKAVRSMARSPSKEQPHILTAQRGRQQLLVCLICSERCWAALAVTVRRRRCAEGIQVGTQGSDSTGSWAPRSRIRGSICRLVGADQGDDFLPSRTVVRPPAITRPKTVALGTLEKRSTSTRRVDFASPATGPAMAARCSATQLGAQCADCAADPSRYCARPVVVWGSST